MTTIGEAQEQAWCMAQAKGFHGEAAGEKRMGREEALTYLCLVHTEVSEAAQGVKRHWKGEPTAQQKAEFAEEMADAFIRILDLCECVGVDLEPAYEAKMRKNWMRPHRYGTPQAIEEG